MSEWIKVSERLPAEKSSRKSSSFTWVIVAAKPKVVAEAAFCSFKQGFLQLLGDEWVDISVDVTHWMPLPAPPEVE